MKKLQLFFLLLSLSLLAACHKEKDCPPDLPCATQSGENTFGCYVDGKPWVAEIAPYILAPELHQLEVYYDETNYGLFYNNILHIAGTRVNAQSDGFISFNFSPITQSGIIRSEDVNLFSAFGQVLTLNNHVIVSGQSFDIDPLFDYKIEITHLDTVKNIISGTFFFTGTSKTDTVKITDGRFDVRYNQE